MDKLKRIVGSMPVIGPLARKLRDLLLRLGDARGIPRRLHELSVRLDAKASAADIEKLRRDMLILQRRIDRLAQDAAPSATAQASPPLPEGFYLAFENRFRGGFEAIQTRQSVYLPVIRAAEAGTAARPILDIGCGRGEWLQLLGKHRLEAGGVDTDPSMVASCADLGLSARLSDAFEHLAKLDEASLGAITGFHIAEHIPFNALVALFDEALRALQPGGVLILETPNPENLLVGACYFYTDPTHQHPLPPDLLAFIAENRGFAQVEIMRLHPFPQYVAAQSREGGASEIERFVFGPQDYALIARKPTTTSSDAN